MTDYLAPTKKVRVADLAQKKASGEKWAMLTAYDYSTARAVVDAGADLVVFEMVPAALAAKITRECPIPTVGIRASPDTDAQVLVWHDMADLPAGDHRARFVRRFGTIGADLTAAAANYKRAVHTGEFPAEGHTFS